jgi:alpha-tubulin suppressor-like RCC1 family protein
MAITTGNSHACALDSDGRAYCWGHNGADNGVTTKKIYGQLGGNLDATFSLAPIAVDTTGLLKDKVIISIAAGGFHTCSVTSDNLAYCWGMNDDGQLGNGLKINSSVPVVVQDL